MKKILSICDNHDSGACIFNSSGIIFAVNEERLNREKLTKKFPVLSIKECIKRLDTKEEVFVVFSSFMTPSCIFRLLNKLYSKKNKNPQFRYFLNLYIIYQVFMRKTGLYYIDKKISYLLLKRKLKKFFRNKVKFKKLKIVDHHVSHAYSAYSFSGFEDPLIITADSMGDGLSITINTIEKEKLKKIYEETGFSAISLYYSRITEFLGFKAIRHEGKILGLAAHGDPNKTQHLMKNLVHYNGHGGFNKLNHFLPVSKSLGVYSKLKKYKKEDIAAGLQKNLEIQFIEFVKYWLKKTKKKDVCLAGGLFANVKLNQRIHELEDVENIFIFPHMGDGGLAAGAGSYYLNKKNNKLNSLYLGPEYSDFEIEFALKKSGLEYKLIKKMSNISKKIAILLNENNVVALFSGKMEYGPRALGNRSILYRPDDKTINDWLNKKLKRTEFMPFAPAVLMEDAEKCFKNIKGAEYAAKFMTITFECTDMMKKKCPGVVHIDGTARPQFVEKKDNLLYYRIIHEFKRISGLPCIINTSFNMHEEPIVCTPEDAIRAFKDSNLDYLAIGSYLVKGN